LSDALARLEKVRTSYNNKKSSQPELRRPAEIRATRVAFEREMIEKENARFARRKRRFMLMLQKHCHDCEMWMEEAE